LLRRGRFDETFFVDLPDHGERHAVLALHLRRRGRDPGSFDLDAIARSTEGFSGAELEGIVVAALYSAFSAKTDVTTELLAREAGATTPLARSRAADIESMRAWARGRAILAGARPQRMEGE
jgi:SpoVK/Ycf46/Vps4 family AAA+-type ATPase